MLKDSIMKNKIVVGFIILIVIKGKFSTKTIGDSVDCIYTESERINKNCSHPKCPDDSVGIFPNCNCVSSNFDYSISLNKCFRVCPMNSTGYWPNCVCSRGGFDKAGFQCIECPSDVSNGIFPNCVCRDKEAQFNAFYNYCETCPADSTGIIPNCVCNDGAG